MDQQKSLLKLQQLCQLDIDAIGTYDAALARVSDDEVKTRLQEFRIDHVRHVQDLNALIVKMGGDPLGLDQQDLKGRALSGLTRVTSALGTEAALIAMYGNEQLTTRTYQDALKQELEREARELVEKNFGDEKRHLDWIRHAARSRLWERRGEAHV